MAAATVDAVPDPCLIPRESPITQTMDGDPAEDRTADLADSRTGLSASKIMSSAVVQRQRLLLLADHADVQRSADSCSGPTASTHTSLPIDRTLYS
jgi:hypothetical protein